MRYKCILKNTKKYFLYFKIQWENVGKLLWQNLI